MQTLKSTDELSVTCWTLKVAFKDSNLNVMPLPLSFNDLVRKKVLKHVINIPESMLCLPFTYCAFVTKSYSVDPKCQTNVLNAFSSNRL